MLSASIFENASLYALSTRTVPSGTIHSPFTVSIWKVSPKPPIVVEVERTALSPLGSTHKYFPFAIDLIANCLFLLVSSAYLSITNFSPLYIAEVLAVRYAPSLTIHIYFPDTNDLKETVPSSFLIILNCSHSSLLSLVATIVVSLLPFLHIAY